MIRTTILFLPVLLARRLGQSQSDKTVFALGSSPRGIVTSLSSPFIRSFLPHRSFFGRGPRFPSLRGGQRRRHRDHRRPLFPLLLQSPDSGPPSSFLLSSITAKATLARLLAMISSPLSSFLPRWMGPFALLPADAAPRRGRLARSLGLFSYPARSRKSGTTSSPSPSLSLPFPVALQSSTAACVRFWLASLSLSLSLCCDARRRALFRALMGRPRGGRRPMDMDSPISQKGTRQKGVDLQHRYHLSTTREKKR